MSRAMSRSSVIVFVSSSAIFTLCRAKQIHWEQYAHSPFCGEPGGTVGRITFVPFTGLRFSLGNTLKRLVVTTMLCSWEMQEVSAKASMTAYGTMLQHTHRYQLWRD